MTRRLDPKQPFGQSEKQMKFASEAASRAAFDLLMAAVTTPYDRAHVLGLADAFRREAYAAVGEVPP